MFVNPKFPLPGTEVGQKNRWPYFSAHPDCWQEPHKGLVLYLDDPRAWQNTIKFPCMIPSQEQCSQHVEECLSKGQLQASVPVLWTFFDKKHVYWECELRLYAEELAAWKRARGLVWAMVGKQNAL